MDENNRNDPQRCLNLTTDLRPRDCIEQQRHLIPG